MQILTYKGYRLLRTNPSDFFRKPIKQDLTNEEKYSLLVKTMYKNPLTLNDFFVIPPDVSKEDVKGKDFMEIYSSLVIDYLKNNSEMHQEVLTAINNRARTLAGLSTDYEPSDNLIKYGEYLTVREERIEIDKLMEEKAYNLSKKIRTFIPHGQEESTELTGLFTEPGYKGLDTVLWIKPKNTIELTSKLDLLGYQQDKFNIEIEADHIIYNKKTAKAKITYLAISNPITKFPDFYKNQNLENYIAFNYLGLKTLFKDIEVRYLVFDDTGRNYSFSIQNIPDLLEDVSKAIYSLERGDNLPYEYINNKMIL